MRCQDFGLFQLGHAKLSRSITTTLAVSVRTIRLRKSFKATIQTSLQPPIVEKAASNVSRWRWATLPLIDADDLQESAP